MARPRKKKVVIDQQPTRQSQQPKPTQQPSSSVEILETNQIEDPQAITSRHVPLEFEHMVLQINHGGKLETNPIIYYAGKSSRQPSKKSKKDPQPSGSVAPLPANPSMKTKRDPPPSGSAASTLQSVTRSVLTPTPPPPQRPTAPPSQRPTAPPSQRYTAPPQRPTAPPSQRPTAPPQRHAAPPQRHAAPPSKAPPSQKPAAPPQRPAAPPSKATKATKAPWGSGALAVKVEEPISWEVAEGISFHQDQPCPTPRRMQI